jgi:hypothetical protein
MSGLEIPRKNERYGNVKPAITFSIKLHRLADAYNPYAFSV